MKLALICALSLAFVTACLTSAYESKPGVPTNKQ